MTDGVLGTIKYSSLIGKDGEVLINVLQKQADNPVKNAIPMLRVTSIADFSQKLESLGGKDQLVGNAFFSPGRILCGHLSDESAQVLRDLRSAKRPGFPASEKAESLAVPAQERIGLDVHQGATPKENAPPGSP